MTPKQMVLAKEPLAEDWWNPLDMDWCVWDQPVKISTARIIGEGITKDEAWVDAANKLYLPKWS